MNDTGSLFRQLKDQVIHPRTLLIIIFILISSILILHHEPYEDEAQAWMIARSSPDIPALVGFIGNEGTPALWHLILFGLSHSGLPYLSMAVVHSLIITGALFLFLRYSPFSSLHKVFFSFGYFILYE